MKHLTLVVVSFFLWREWEWQSERKKSKIILIHIYVSECVHFLLLFILVVYLFFSSSPLSWSFYVVVSLEYILFVSFFLTPITTLLTVVIVWAVFFFIFFLQITIYVQNRIYVCLPLNKRKVKVRFYLSTLDFTNDKKSKRTKCVSLFWHSTCASRYIECLFKDLMNQPWHFNLLHFS